MSTEVIPDPSKLHLKTIVNGDVRQSETIDDLCFKVPYIVSYCSQGTTLKKGTVIMTGTPSGKQMMQVKYQGAVTTDKL